MVGAPSVPSYSTPLAMNWVQESVAGQPSNVILLRNLGSDLCLERKSVGGSTSPSSAVVLAKCDTSIVASRWRLATPPPFPPAPAPVLRGQVRASPCGSATSWHYTPGANAITGGGAMIVAGRPVLLLFLY